MDGGRGRGCSGRAGAGCGAGGVAVSQEARWGGGIWVLLLECCLGVLAVGGTVVQVGDVTDGAGHLCGQHQAGLHKGLWVDILLGQPAHRHKDQIGRRLKRGCSRAEKPKGLASIIYICSLRASMNINF